VLDRIAADNFAYLIPGQGAIQKDRAYLIKTKTALAKILNETTALAQKGEALAESIAQVVQATAEIGALFAATGDPGGMSQ
jgi:hypothetical protein